MVVKSQDDLLDVDNVFLFLLIKFFLLTLYLIYIFNRPQSRAFLYFGFSTKSLKLYSKKGHNVVGWMVYEMDNKRNNFNEWMVNLIKMMYSMLLIESNFCGGVYNTSK